MIPYFLILFVVVFIAYIGRRYGSNSVRIISLTLVFLLLVVFAGLRDRSVGTDTGNYIWMLLSTNTFIDVFRTTEFGFNTLLLISKSISNDYSILLTLIAFVVVGLYISTIAKLTERYETAVFLFITLGAYTFFFNGARQGIAAAICFFAIPYLLERKPKQYFLLVALAFTFHHTALIASLLYFLAVPRVSWRQIVAVVVGSVIMTLFLTVFVQLAAVLVDDKYSSYAEVTEGGGRVLVAFFVAQGTLLYLLRNKAKDKNGYYSKLLNIYLIGLMPLVAAVFSNVNPSGIIRLHMYFSSTAIVLWPMIFIGLNKARERNILSLFFLLFMLFFFYLTTSSFSKLVPYEISIGVL